MDASPSHTILQKNLQATWLVHLCVQLNANSLQAVPPGTQHLHSSSCPYSSRLLLFESKGLRIRLLPAGRGHGDGLLLSHFMHRRLFRCTLFEGVVVDSLERGQLVAGRGELFGLLCGLKVRAGGLAGRGRVHLGRDRLHPPARNYLRLNVPVALVLRKPCVTLDVCLFLRPECAHRTVPRESIYGVTVVLRLLIGGIRLLVRPFLAAILVLGVLLVSVLLLLLEHLARGRHWGVSHRVDRWIGTVHVLPLHGTVALLIDLPLD